MVTPHHTYDDMLLSALTVTQDEEHPDGWTGNIAFTEYIPVVALSETKTNDNSSTPKNIGSVAPPKTVSGTAVNIPQAAGSGAASGVGAIVTGFISLQSGSTLEQKLSRAGITTDQVQYIV